MEARVISREEEGKAVFVKACHRIGKGFQAQRETF
jgi:hypothetical protein